MPPRTLRRGDRGDDVVLLQNRLKARGINPGPSDGVFGSLTDAAVRRFQDREGLTVDGIVGPITWGALGVNGATPPADPGPAPTQARAPVLHLWGRARGFWGGLQNWGTCNPASRLPSGGLSQHAYCNAIDIAHPNFTTMLAVSLWAVHNAAGLATARVIFNKRVWSADNPNWREYLGPHDHRDHVHIDFIPTYTGSLPGVPVGQAFAPGFVEPPFGVPPGEEPPAEPVPAVEEYPVPPRIEPPFNEYWGRRAALLLWAQFGGMTPRHPLDELRLALEIRRWRSSLGEARSDALLGSLWGRLYRTVLAVGSDMRRVVVLHTLLHSYGMYAPLPVSSAFDSVTLAAVLEAQRRSGVTVDGDVGPQTFQAILWGPHYWPDNPNRLPFVINPRTDDVPTGGHLVESWAPHIEVAFGPVPELARRLRGAEFSLRRL